MTSPARRALVAASLLVLAGCTSPAGTARSAAPTSGSSEPDDACALLTSSEANRLAATTLGARKPNPVGLRSCIWDGGSTWVTAASVPAAYWVDDLPDEGDTSLAFDLSPAERRRVAAASGCAAFARALAIKGQRGPVLVTVAARLVDVRSVTASTCTRGRFTAVTSVRRIRAPHVSDALLRRYLDLAHRRALAGR